MELARRLAREGKISTSTAASIYGCSTKAAQRSGGPSAILGVMTEDDMVDMDLVIGVAHFGLEEETGPELLEGAAFLWGLGAGGVAEGEGTGAEEAAAALLGQGGAGRVAAEGQEEEEREEEKWEELLEEEGEEEEEGADDDDGEGRDGAGGFQQQTSLPFRPFK